MRKGAPTSPFFEQVLPSNMANFFRATFASCFSHDTRLTLEVMVHGLRQGSNYQLPNNKEANQTKRTPFFLHTFLPFAPTISFPIKRSKSLSPRWLTCFYVHSFGVFYEVLVSHEAIWPKKRKDEGVDEGASARQECPLTIQHMDTVLFTMLSESSAEGSFSQSVTFELCVFSSIFEP